MKETAFICRNSTPKSLILIDELGRATSNEDGVAIAWAVSEQLLKSNALTFFVTHYPQVTLMSSVYPSVQNFHLEASVGKGEHGDIFYTHKVGSGPCTVATSYGVDLAYACGWPGDVLGEVGPDGKPITQTDLLGLCKPLPAAPVLLTSFLYPCLSTTKWNRRENLNRI